ncbi:hypothetical protein B0H17DRAFT_1146220 [Mycena rosella]|uniref:Uncharacterized protein n=1 Tax=Mycena rosella TaxID=1033263 RepID=A0AAD7G3P2_MYCRO|nr:hypothetical protein B0H17DRAFT_1146220 [Mycena rosella]
MSNPQQMWVQSPKGVYYWCNATRSIWKGPRDDCIWVSSQDSPTGMLPLPNDFAEQPGDPAPILPPTEAAHNFGSLTLLSYLQNTWAFPLTGTGGKGCGTCHNGIRQACARHLLRHRTNT